MIPCMGLLRRIIMMLLLPINQTVIMAIFNPFFFLLAKKYSGLKKNKKRSRGDSDMFVGVDGHLRFLVLSNLVVFMK